MNYEQRDPFGMYKASTPASGPESRMAPART